MTRRNINFEDAQWEKLREKAFKERSNPSKLVREAVELYLGSGKELGTIVPKKRKEKDERR